ncbi:transposase [Nonomuraea aurantiaca]|uniref:transposase n=1 Tax=Nonomuraea aurantiaca TaxID=2878562 RepID=UPI001CD9C6F0|nr:transposase [Nonomuraea aurantiaca]MCA2230057.1 transposase [Nonomuraea aurantiaca]
MWCLTVATSSIVTWTTEYYGLAVGGLRRAGRPVDDDLVAHIWPSHHANVNFYGTHTVDIDGELAKLDVDGYRPLRLPAVTVPMRH